MDLHRVIIIEMLVCSTTAVVTPFYMKTLSDHSCPSVAIHFDEDVSLFVVELGEHVGRC